MFIFSFILPVLGLYKAGLDFLEIAVVGLWNDLNPFVGEPIADNGLKVLLKFVLIVEPNDYAVSGRALNGFGLSNWLDFYKSY